MYGPDAIKISKHFSFDDPWGDPELVCADLVIILGEMSDEYSGKIRIVPNDLAVLNPNMKDHEFESWHAPTENRNEFAMAADIIPIGNFLEAYILAMKYFTSVGFYPHHTYYYNNKCYYGALHVDIRKKDFFCDCNLLWWYNTSLDKYEVVTGSKINDIINMIQIIDQRTLLQK